MPESHKQQQAEWRKVLEDKQARFKEFNSNSFRLVDFDEFTQYLHSINLTYQRRGWNRFIAHFQGRLEHIRSFEKAISAMAQASDLSTFLWGAIQAVIESAIRHASIIEGIFGLLTELATCLPYFEESMALYPDEPTLHWPLRDMFSEFADFCLAISQYLERGTLRNFIGGLLRSTPQKTLDRTKARIDKHRQQFEREFTLVYRRETRRGIFEKPHPNPAPNTIPMPDLILSSPSSLALRVKFPVETGRPTRNFKFRGRIDVLKTIENVLSTSPNELGDIINSDSACCVIHGIAGVGKSQAALEYSYTYGIKYQAIFWLRAETPVVLTKSFGMIAAKLKLHQVLIPQSGQDSSGSVPTWSVVDLAKEWLEKTDKPWLLVFDNVERTRDIEPFIPRNPTRQGSIIITTQRPDIRQFTRIFHQIPLQSLNDEDGSALLLNYLNQSSNNSEDLANAYQISQFVGGLPLAIAVIGGYITMSNTTLPEFLGHLKRSSKVWGRKISPVDNYEHTLGAVFDLAISELGEAPLKIIHLLSFLNPDAIPEQMIVTKHKDKSLDFLSNIDEYIAAVNELKFRQLVKRELSGDGTFFLSIHRTIQLYVLNILSAHPSLRMVTFQQAFDVVGQQLPQTSRIRVPQPELDGIYDTYLPQLLSLHSHSLWPEPRLTLTLEFAKMVANCGVLMWHNRQLFAGDKALRSARDILRIHGYDDEDPLIGDIDSTLSHIADTIGISRRAESIRWRGNAVRAREKEYASIPPELRTMTDHIRYFNSKSSLACCLLQDERAEEVIGLMEECLKAYKTWGSEEQFPFEYAKYYENVGMASMQLGRTEVGVEFLKRACELQVLHSGPNGRRTLQGFFLLGNQYYIHGDIKSALEINIRVLQNRRKVCGEANMETLDSYSMTGALYFRAQQHEKAREHFLKCLEVQYRTAWSEECIAVARHRLAEVLHALGEVTEAEKQEKAALAVRTKYEDKFPEFFKNLSSDDPTIWDQLISDCSGRLTTRRGGGLIIPEQSYVDFKTL